MTADLLVLERRKAGFDHFYSELMPVLVEFVDSLGIHPAHEVLNHAAQYVPHVQSALAQMVVADDDDRHWLLTRMVYFIGEYFVQQFGGCWYVSDIPDSRYFGRYVVGQFRTATTPGGMVEPFELAVRYIDSPLPRQLEPLLASISADLLS